MACTPSCSQWRGPFGTCDAAKPKEHLKSGVVWFPRGVKGQVEHLQARDSLAMNGQCTVANLKRLLTYLDLSYSGSDAELV